MMPCLVVRNWREMQLAGVFLVTIAPATTLPIAGLLSLDAGLEFAAHWEQ